MSTQTKLSVSILFAIIVVLSTCLFSSFAVASEAELKELRTAIMNKGTQWVAEETSVSRLTADQRQKRLGLIKPDGTLSSAGSTAVLRSTPGVTLPTSFDYRNFNGKNCVTPIRDQGGCGSCWAFAATAALESQVLKNDMTGVDGAEQILVSCSGAGSCNGGYIDRASNFVQITGLAQEACFPYTGADTSCSRACSNWQSVNYKITDWQWVATTAPTVDAIKNALVSHGPLVTTMDVYTDFFYYAGGVYSHTSGNYEGGHAVAIIGYDDIHQCFIVKNSWGTSWGDAGFFRIAYTQLTTVVHFGDFTIAYGFKKPLPLSPPTGVHIVK